MPPSAEYADAPYVSRMPLSDDVFRGMRWGAILLAGLAICVAGYRLVRESPPKPAHETSSSAPVLPSTEHENSASPPPAKAIDKPANKPAFLTSGSRPVPPPPARAAKPPVANPPRTGSGDGVPAGEPASKNQDDSVPERLAEPSAGPADEKDADQSSAEKDDSASSGPGALTENATKPEARGKRWIKTVGRWLGIGRKDPQPH
jgi:hypothetical protein